MTVHLIAHPFRLGNDGRVQTHEQDSDAYIAERIALVLGCRPGERPLVPAFGVPDPTFSELSLVSVQNQMVIFNIPAQITDIRRGAVNEGHISYTISFERIEEQGA